MTTPNHTAVAILVFIVTRDCSPETKVVAALGLIVGHLALDLIPHYHYAFPDELRTPQGRHKWWRAVIEVGGGGIIIPLLISWAFKLSVNETYWLFLMAWSASVFDALSLVVPQFDRFTANVLHFWEKTMTVGRRIVWEVSQTIILYTTLIVVMSVVIS